METEILNRIIEETQKKLDETETDLNILDLLQTYDRYISKYCKHICCNFHTFIIYFE